MEQNKPTSFKYLAERGYKQDLVVTRRTFQAGLDHQSLTESPKKLDGHSIKGEVIKALVVYRGKIYLAKSGLGEQKVEMKEL